MRVTCRCTRVLQVCAVNAAGVIPQDSTALSPVISSALCYHSVKCNFRSRLANIYWAASRLVSLWWYHVPQNVLDTVSVSRKVPLRIPLLQK